VHEDIGAARLSSITRVELQRLVDRLVADGLSGQTVRNAVTAVAVVYRYALRRGWVSVNPTRELELPAPAGRRERIVDPEQAAKLLSALPLEVRSIYGLAIYGGLRRGEIAGLAWRHVDFGASRITVERSWCWRAGGFVTPKTKAGTRTVPMVAPLAAILLEHKIGSGGEGLMFPSPREPARPFEPRSLARRADKAWKDAGLFAERIILHEGRHSAASAYIASGLDPVRVSKWLGHSQVSTTTDVYAKAFEARERHDAEKVEAFYAQPAEEVEGVGQSAGQ
jgi:integrase